MFAGSDEGDCFGFALHSGVIDRRGNCIFGEKIIPGFQNDGMHKHDFAGNVAGFFEIRGAAVAYVDHRNMFDWCQRGSPRDRYAPDTEVDSGNLRELGIERGAGGADGHLGCAFCPGMRDGEFFGMDAIGAGDLERVHSPVDRALHGGRSGNASADFVSQFAQVVLYRGWLECQLNDAIALLESAGWGAAWDRVPKIRQRQIIVTGRNRVH